MSATSASTVAMTAPPASTNTTSSWASRTHDRATAPSVGWPRVTIEEGEAIVSQRWDKWGEPTIRWFVGKLQPTELRTPLALKWACEHFDSLPTESQADLGRLGAMRFLRAGPR